MIRFYVATLANYVLVAADSPETAYAAALPLLAAMTGRQPVIVALRPASPEEIELQDFHERAMAGEVRVGDRIRLLSMTDDPDPVPPGTEGTVVEIVTHHDWFQIDVDWHGVESSLMLTVPPDKFEIVRARKPPASGSAIRP